MSKRLFILLTFFVVLGLVVPNVAFSDTIDIRVAAGEDDSEEKVATGAIDLTSSDLEITEEGGPDDNQLVGTRFANVAIPQGATITGAYVQFHVDEVDVPGDNRPGTKFLKGEAVDDAASFTEAPFDISSRLTTTAEASWDWPEWLTVHEEGPDQQTSDISAVIQEIVDRPGWSAGNSLVLIITGSGENAAEAFEGEADAAALLHVEFTSGGAPAVGGPTGTIMREVWSDIGGTNVSDLTNNANFPDNPTFGDELTLFETPTDFADNFGSRVYGWLHPATSGDYTFWIATDDSSDLFLSTDDDPANAVVICGVDGWCPARAFDGEAGSPGTRQMSAPIALEAGGKYYIEAIYKEGGGGDNLAVAWQGPDSPDRTVIDGSFLSPAPWNIVLKRAKDPNPADGAIDADTASLEWAPGPSSVSYKVYLSTDATIEESELVAETDLTIHLAALEDGASYWWRVDAVEADGNVIEGALWSFTTLPLEAHFPSPADGARNIESGAKLSWTAGKGVIMHDVYFGTDEAAVAAGDPSTFKGKVMVTSYDPGPLELFTTYYWKIDEFSVTGTNPGPVWSFSAPGYIVITSDEVTLDYDNTADPFVSELALDVPADLRFGGVADLTLRFQGKAPSGVIYDEATGTYTITGGGHDIWDNADDFHFGYRELTGDATMIARVVDNGTGSNTWAKGGVMIRQSIDAGSAHSFMPITGGGGNGASFQGRPVADGGSINSDSGEVVAPPYWVKLERVGNDFSGSISPDGVTWTQLGGVNTVEMTDPVLIGLAVTSHQTGELRTFTFDNVDIVGDITADTASTDIGDDPGGNAPAPIYVALEDSTGAVASVTHGNPAATNIESWRQWTIPLDKFEGVDASSAAKLYVGVGDGEPGGTGSITIDDVFVVKPDVTAGIASWEAAAAAASPGFIATNVADALVDIGQYGGEQTYEFVVRSNPDETEASMALIGRRQFGDTQVGLKFDQWNNTGEYGATVFGVVDLYYGIANHPGVDTHLVFVSSETTNTTALYINGALAGSVDSAISLSGLVGIGYGAQGEDGSGVFDDFDGDIFGVAIYDAALSDADIAAHANAFFAPAKDVTLPGDIVKGVPDEPRDGSVAGWPSNEHPALAIDDNTGTKYLHFKGEVEPTGFKVTPLDGPSVVTGLTFTTANDAAPRDPISFELSGSNDSIDGPYTLIASGDIVDFAQEAAWPRFTKNETPISFANNVAYAHYQVMFPAVRDPGSANSMQIAEVELLTGAAPAGGANIIWVSGTYDDNGDGAPDDQEWVDLLTAAGHTVDYNGTYWRELDDDKIAALNAADLVIVSRNSNSGDYDDGDEPTQWNAVTTPIINSSTHIVRSSRWKWVDSTTILSLTPAMVLADGTEIPGINADVGPTSFIDAAPGNGTVLATGDGLPFIIEWEAGVEYYDGAGQTAGGPRVFFAAGTQEDSATGVGRGEMNLSPEALALFMDTVNGLLEAPEEPVEAENLLANGGFEDGVMAPWSTYGSLVTTAEVVQTLDGAAVPEDPIEGSSCLHVMVADAGANFWDAGLQHAGHIFEAGKSYTLSVYMKSKSGTLDINIKPERGADPWEGYGDQIVTITEEWAQYSVTTPVLDADVDPASITFHIAFTTGDFWVDGASWTVVE